ncbi:MAG: AsmA family protein [Candidatus Omnitrophota bacterium]
MKKIIVIIFLLILILAGATAYLNNAFLPQKIKSLIINNLQQATHKNVSLGALQFSIFKGLVLKNLNIYEGEKSVVNIKEASCTFLILPLLQKKIIIPKVKVKQAVISLVRKGDNTFNIPLLVALPPQAAPIEKPQKEIQGLAAPKAAVVPKKKFSVIVNSIAIKGARINFQDDTLSPVFNKTIENLNLDLSLSLPASIKFSLKSQIIASPVINITAAGEYKIPELAFTAKISLQNLSCQEFSAYLKGEGFDISEGLINTQVDLKSKDGEFLALVLAQGEDLVVSKENIRASLALDTKVSIEYGLKENRLKFSGKSTISKAMVKGLEGIGEINSINGELAFDNSGIHSDKLNADILGIPVVAQFKLQDFKNPFLDINIAATLSLDTAQGILKDRFKFILPASVKGNASLVLNIKGNAPIQENLQASGYLDIISAFVKPDKFPSSLEDINGRVNFSQDSFSWEDLNFKYSGAPYKTRGSLTGFKSPKVELALISSELSLDSSLAVNKSFISLVKLEGRYLNSKFSVSGKLDTSAPSRPGADLKGELDIYAQDLKKLFAKFKNQLEQADPQGRVNMQFFLNGDINDFKSCALQAKLSSPRLSIYGLKPESLSLDYTQGNGMADISLMQLSLYDGVAKISAKMNLGSQNIPYSATLDMQGVKLEKLKMDTGARNKDISGTLSSRIKINGFYGDISSLSGAGNILIAEGKLWQLNLFKGLGSLIFARDFADIIFKDGSCDFLIKDKQILSDNITLKSNIADISGSARIGFDSSLDASLNVKILDEMAPLSGGFKDLATAIMGEAGRFGIIKISGTLKEPKYKFKPAVVDIIKGLKDIIFGK